MEMTPKIPGATPKGLSVNVNRNPRIGNEGNEEDSRASNAFAHCPADRRGDTDHH
jgi:hypothetical protein